jgi:hypothetical protein
MNATRTSRRLGLAAVALLVVAGGWSWLWAFQAEDRTSDEPNTMVELVMALPDAGDPGRMRRLAGRLKSARNEFLLSLACGACSENEPVRRVSLLLVDDVRRQARIIALADGLDPNRAEAVLGLFETNPELLGLMASDQGSARRKALRLMRGANEPEALGPLMAIMVGDPNARIAAAALGTIEKRDDIPSAMVDAMTRRIADADDAVWESFAADGPDDALQAHRELLLRCRSLLADCPKGELIGSLLKLLPSDADRPAAVALWYLAPLFENMQSHPLRWQVREALGRFLKNPQPVFRTRVNGETIRSLTCDAAINALVRLQNRSAGDLGMIGWTLPSGLKVWGFASPEARREAVTSVALKPSGSAGDGRP